MEIITFTQGDFVDSCILGTIYGSRFKIVNNDENEAIGGINVGEQDGHFQIASGTNSTIYKPAHLLSL